MISKDNKFKSFNDAKDKIAFMKEADLPIDQKIWDWYQEWEEEELQMQSVAKQYPIYTHLKNQIGYTDELQECIKKTTDELLKDGEGADKPGLLLGKIQSGKTRAFVGVMALCFDRGVDICVILTKGTKPLAEQTVLRMNADFYDFVDGKQQNPNLPEVKIYDIIEVKTGIPQYNLNSNKVIIVCKKEARNLEHLIKLFNKNKSIIDQKKVLIIDDEADFAGHSFTSKDGKDKMLKITSLVNKLRDILNYCRILNVTATPYSLYLQPDDEIQISNGKVLPAKPRFTVLVPIHKDYIGGKQYFEDSKNPDSMYYDLFSDVSEKCMSVFRNPRANYINNPYSNTINDIRRAVISYFMATAIRKIQNGGFYRSSFLVHIDTGKKNHELQVRLLNAMIDSLRDSLNMGNQKMNPTDFAWLNIIYPIFYLSIDKGKKEGLLDANLPVPKLDIIQDEMKSLLNSKDYRVVPVNSDNDVKQLLDKRTGQLKLELTANIFVGGGILDRGITIDHMLAFFYGRDAKTKQQDTVLQHARMYGNRSKEDMAVTRFYTTNSIYSALVRINDLDNQLRDWFESSVTKGTDPSAVFVGYDSKMGIRPCASNKLTISDTLTIKPGKRVLPIGFQTLSNSEIKGTIKKIDEILNKPEYQKRDKDGFFEIGKAEVLNILELINKTFYRHPKRTRKGQTVLTIYQDAVDWNLEEMIASLEYCLQNVKGNKLFAMVRVNRDMSRKRANQGFIDAPDDGRTDTAPSRVKAVDRPVVMFIKQNGEKAKGWHDAPFYWPVLMTQKNIKSAVYTIDNK
jgi:hypothetical protein